MKIRKGFVTNSSSTNFGVMAVTSLAGISAAALISPYEYDEHAKEKAYVKLVVEAPVRRLLKPGQTISISAQIMKAEIIEGKISEEVSMMGGASITCISGMEVINMEPAGKESSGSTVSFTVIDDLDALRKFSQSISFKVSAMCEGKKLSAGIDFCVPCFGLSPAEGNFIVDKETELELKLQSNYDTEYRYDFEEGKLLRSEILENGDMYQKINLKEAVEDVKSRFNIFTCKQVKDYKVDAPLEGGILSANFRAVFLRECMIVPKSTKLPPIIKCYKDEDSNKRTEEAYQFAIKVLKYDETAKTLKTDIELTNNLTFTIEPSQNNGRLKYEDAKKVIDQACITAELLPQKGAATEKQPFAIYRIYADAFVEAETDNVEMKVTISCSDNDIEDIVINAKLKPRISLKGLIREFIEYPVGTYIGVLAKLGDVDIYHDALDQLTDIKKITSGNPKYDPNSDVLLLRDIPESIAEFKEVQTLHHEIAHKIERINGESFSRFQDDSWGERHTYFIQYLSDAVKALADIERGAVSDIDAKIGHAIQKYNQAYYNVDNLKYPPNEGEISSWFGVRTLNQHEIFDRYRDFSIHCMNSSLPDAAKQEVERSAAKSYFPGDIKGYWKEVGGLFDGGEWSMAWQEGTVFSIKPRHSGYTFTELSRKWLGGNRLAFEARYLVIREFDKDEDELIAVFDAGTFDSKSWSYPTVNKFTLKWKAGRTLSDCILGAHMDKEVELVRK